MLEQAFLFGVVVATIGCFVMDIPALFSFSFLLGLTGAMSPGPFLTTAITQTAKRGPFAGPLLMLGHGALELILVVLIVAGLGDLLDNRLFFAFVSFLGGPILIYMGVSALRGLKRYTLSGGAGPKAAELHPILSGIVLSVTNPYWFIWWVSVATGYVMFAKALGGLQGLIAFYTGHISADFAWFGFVSFSAHFGGRFLKPAVMKVILVACNVFLVLFGLYFVANGFRLIHG
jgi:threonine/homoserine/homoserine lactone efflux protein